MPPDACYIRLDRETDQPDFPLVLLFGSGGGLLAIFADDGRFERMLDCDAAAQKKK